MSFPDEPGAARRFQCSIENVKPTVCPNCGSRPVLDSTCACLDCAGRIKVFAKLRSLLEEEHKLVTPEEVEMRCRGLITGVYKTVDNHWQFGFRGHRARLPGILAAAAELKLKAFDGSAEVVEAAPPPPPPTAAKPKRKASFGSEGLWLDHSSADQARRNLSMSRDQVQIAEAHLLCCIDDHEQLQEQLIALKSHIAAAGQKRKKAERKLAVAQAEEAASAQDLQVQQDKLAYQCKEAKRLLDEELAQAMAYTSDDDTKSGS